MRSKFATVAILTYIIFCAPTTSIAALKIRVNEYEATLQSPYRPKRVSPAKVGGALIAIGIIAYAAYRAGLARTTWDGTRRGCNQAGRTIAQAGRTAWPYVHVGLLGVSFLAGCAANKFDYMGNSMRFDYLCKAYKTHFQTQV